MYRPNILLRKIYFKWANKTMPHEHNTCYMFCWRFDSNLTKKKNIEALCKFCSMRSSFKDPLNISIILQLMFWPLLIENHLSSQLQKIYYTFNMSNMIITFNSNSSIHPVIPSKNSCLKYPNIDLI